MGSDDPLSVAHPGWSWVADDGAPPAATAVMTTPADTPADWLRAGQAVQRLLLHAAAGWVSASMYTEPLEFAPIRSLVRSGLLLAGRRRWCSSSAGSAPQPTPRRPVSEVLSLS
jgi:hypothetical protein